MQRLRSVLSTVYLVGALLSLLAACGKKPDGTPYGVDPAKLPEGRRRKAAAAMHRKDMPKGAELNAVSNGAKAGQPTPAPASGRATPSR